MSVSLEIHMFLKDPVLEADERVMLRQALFYLQKHMYTKHGYMPEQQLKTISSIATKLHLR